MSFTPSCNGLAWSTATEAVVEALGFFFLGEDSLAAPSFGMTKNDKTLVAFRLAIWTWIEAKGDPHHLVLPLSDLPKPSFISVVPADAVSAPSRR